MKTYTIENTTMLRIRHGVAIASQTCPDCAAARAAMVDLAIGHTVHETPRGFIRATLTRGQWTALPGESLGDHGTAFAGSADVLAGMVRTYATAADAIPGLAAAYCTRHDAERSEEYVDLAAGLRHRARFTARVRDGKTRPFGDYVEHVRREGDALLRLLGDEAFARVTERDITDAVVLGAYLDGMRAPGGYEAARRSSLV